MPSDVNAPGLAFSKGNLSFQLGNNRIVISARQWNTIVAGSTVRDLVGSMIDPAFHGTDVTRNRFQYLADRIAQYAATNFEPIGLAEGTGAGQFIEFAALYNPTPQVKKLTGLTVTIVEKQEARTLAKQTFYATPGSALILPAHTIYFARLSFAQFARTGGATGNSVTYSVNFHFDHFVSCKGQVCSTR